MNPEFEDCLKKKKIKKFPPGKSLVKKEINAALKDFNEAEESLGKRKFKWSTIQAYYSMFHSARALLYSKSYREKSHYCLIVALKTLFVEMGELSISFVEGLQKGKRLREDADYYDDWSDTGAHEAIDMAGKFLAAAKKRLDSFVIGSM
ncbi:MAG: HEPN domain-containing protein [Elusimicrobia bacterium]|nr:HEPN domain-containing protein [Elusimicrobiota bacterium]